MPTTVTIGGAPVAVEFISDTEVRTVAPGVATAGPVDVTVTTSAGSDTLTDGFEYLDEVNLGLEVPETVDVTVGTPTVYGTRLTNFGAAGTDVTEEIRLSNDAGDLTVDDVVYESKDRNQGDYEAATLTEDAGDLVATYTFANVPANQDQSSDVRVTVTRDTGDITGSSTYTDADDNVLAQAVYTYEVSA
jgi:hypothetical protein